MPRRTARAPISHAVPRSPIGDAIVPGNPSDPLALNSRLYFQLSEILRSIETESEIFTVRERLAAIIALSRVQLAFLAMRKERFSSVHQAAGASAAGPDLANVTSILSEMEQDDDDEFDRELSSGKRA